jgi:hypothetical protein
LAGILPNGFDANAPVDYFPAAKPGRRSAMQSVFMTSVGSRFIAGA